MMDMVGDGNGGFYKDYEDWYDNGPGSENFKRSQRALNNLANRIVSKIKTGGSKMSDDGFETWKNSEKEKEYVVGSGYADNDFLFNPETNKSTGKVGPRYLKKDPLSWEDETPDKDIKVAVDPVEKKPIVGPAAPIPTIVHGPDTEHSPCCDPPKDQTGHDAFGIRLCSRCGIMSDKSHRVKCAEEYDDDPGLYLVDRNKELEVHIRKISNGYVVSVNDEEQTFYAHDTVIAVLFKDLLGKLS
jgi:hypothetical protein